MGAYIANYQCHINVRRNWKTSHYKTLITSSCVLFNKEEAIIGSFQLNEKL